MDKARQIVTAAVVLINNKRLAVQKLAYEEKRNALNMERNKKGKTKNQNFKGKRKETLSGISNLIESTSKVKIDYNEL